MIHNRAMSVVVAAVVLATGSALSAETLSYTTTPIVSQELSFAGVTRQLEKFDAALGTLTAVTIEVNGFSDAGTLTWTLNSGQPASFVTVGIGATLLIDTPTTENILVNPTTENSGLVDNPSPNSISVTGNNSTDTETENVGSGDFGIYTASFIGETFNLTFDGFLYTNVSTSGGSGIANSPTGTLGGGDVTVTYEYDAIPEPASLILVGLGSIAILGRRRRKA